MPDRPQPGDLFAVRGRRDLLAVYRCERVVSDQVFIVRTVFGSRWSVVAEPSSDPAVKWVGTPLPADPEAPER